jgi:hypothetical protein
MKQPYKLQSGEIIPGVTTICNMLDKPFLLDWAWRLGKEGKDWRDQRDSAGDVGTIVHKLCIDFLSGNELVGFDNELAYKCFRKFAKWWGEETSGPRYELITETPFVSEKYRFGGTPDIFITNKHKLIDLKTSNGIYESMWIQLAGYDILLREHGYRPKEYQIVWIPKFEPTRGTDCYPIRTELKREKEIFKHLLKIYQLRKEP